MRCIHTISAVKDLTNTLHSHDVCCEGDTSTHAPGTDPRVLANALYSQVGSGLATPRRPKNARRNGQCRQ